VGLFSDIRGAGVIGPLDHTYNTFVKAVMGLNPVIVHYGRPADYPNDLIELNSIPTLDGETDESVAYVDEDRHEEYLAEYSLYTDSDRVCAAAKGVYDEPAGETAAVFNFVAPDAPEYVPSAGAAANVTATFSGIYDIDLRYDEASGKYLKYQFFFPHADEAVSKEPLAFDNAFVLFTRYDSFRDLSGVRGRLVEADYSSGGKGYYFTGGCYERISWKMGAVFFELFSSDGSPLPVNAGKSYIAVMDELNEYTLGMEG